MDSALTPDLEVVERIKSLLDGQEHSAAQQAASEAARQYPEHSWLQRANRVLNPRRVTTAPASGAGRTKEFDWLRSNREAYRGQWVALLGGDLIAADHDFDAVLSEVRARTLDGKPLVHHIN